MREEYSRIGTQPDNERRELIANYYGLISLLYQNVGRILIGLARLGLDRNTIVVYSTDHGDWLGDHGLILKGPMHYEGLLRVGLILRGPGVPQGKVVADPVSTLDLPATFLDYAEASPLLPQHSRSLRKMVEGNASRDYAYNEWDLSASTCGLELTLPARRPRLVPHPHVPKRVVPTHRRTRRLPPPPPDEIRRHIRLQRIHPKGCIHADLFRRLARTVHQNLHPRLGQNPYRRHHDVPRRTESPQRNGCAERAAQGTSGGALVPICVRVRDGAWRKALVVPVDS